MTCQFDWALADDEARANGFPLPDRALFHPGGHPILTFHSCHCGKFHWCVPAAEAQGTAATIEEVGEAGCNAARGAGLVPSSGRNWWAFHRPS